ncbi:MAG TPA: type ISP restriction/modification enzyme [Mycobacteriales bacterium]|nr:type ISP restriction/modification enzyme [Mycobacteriales bacterium]
MSFTTIYDVLEQLRSSATSEADKGSKLERLMKAYLETDPVFAEQFSGVWRWTDWPGREGRPDTGIDLVATDAVTGGLVAIQCKFFASDSTISKPDIDSFLSASGKEGFTERIIVSTTDRWNPNAESAIKSQQIPVRRIGLADLEASPVDWSQFSLDTPEVLVTTGRKQLRPHQVEAIEACRTGFEHHDRGKLIMACGTGKTFTALRLAEQLAGAGGSVLFLVPSISLLSQTLREWSVEAEVQLHPLAVCSDRKSTARSRNSDEDISAVDLALPATTNVAVLESRLAQATADEKKMTVVFATYQSIDVVAKAHRGADLAPFDLVICDEAHRTTGVTLADDEDESAFVRVHDSEYIHGARRLYMTATPRIYDDSSKAKAGEANATLASMDDEAKFGPEFHRLGFGDAVAQNLLTDYKVLVLAVDETAVAKTFQSQLSEDGELKLDDAAKIVGCWNGLAKRGHAEHSFTVDPAPMQRAVAFAGTIKGSKRIESLFTEIVDTYVGSNDLAATGEVVSCEVRHVDGTYNALERNTRLDWLRAPVPDGACRILTNARCLSEGVDVPALDAVMFLAPRKSVVDIVQSVGRVMRKAPGKQYGYIILPIGIPENLTPEEALRDNKRYAAVWEILQALRAHDERFDAMINRIDLTSSRDEKINVIGVGGPDGPGEAGAAVQTALALSFASLEEWRDAIYAKIVAKVGSRRYWEDWAKDVADIAQRHITRIAALLDDPSTGIISEFDAFLGGLRGNLNDNITRSDAIDMLAQHLITRPVFDALFAGYDFAAHNPVAQVMERMLARLDEHSLANENETLEKFYESVRMRVLGIDTAEGRQEIIRQLYDRFFATAFPKAVSKLGIAYTGVEIVDFILRSADWALRESFGVGLTQAGVHVLDGFTGTGMFMVRLLQSGLIAPGDLARKYSSELHANEILLLAYYIAAVNIETAYQDVRTDTQGDADYEPFPGLILTDTFQSWEDDDRPDLNVFPENNERLEALKKLDITVILGNPPWSVGQDSANDANQNERYPSLDRSIAETYAARSTATNKNSLYDSYIRAIRWATLRIKDRGVVAYVSNGGWLDSNVADGFRKTLVEEFSDIYVFNLRGNQRTAGEQSRREGGKVFGAGSRATVAITLLVKNPTRTGHATIHYRDIGDYLSQEEKLAIVREAGSLNHVEMQVLTPNDSGDWLNQRSADFGEWMPIGSQERTEVSVFRHYSGGLKSNRDAWVYNFSRANVEMNMRRMIETYSTALAAGDPPPDDPLRISWNRGLLKDYERRRPHKYRPDAMTVGMYRPFSKSHVYFDRAMNDMIYRLPSMFPRAGTDNVGFYCLNPGAEKPFAVLASALIPDLAMYGSNAGQFFARWTYEVAEEDGAMFAASEGDVVGGYRRIDNITDEALVRFRRAYGDTISKDDIFHYVYALLHSQDYRSRYAADLKRMLPRIPLVTDPSSYVAVGRVLCDQHLGYEAIEPFPLEGLDATVVGDPYDFFRVEKMRFGKPTAHQQAKGERADRTTVVYNSQVTLRGVPGDAYGYQLGGRSAIEWIMERYQVKVDKPSGIRNDPNDWSKEIGDPRYVLDLFARIVTLSMRTLELVASLPRLDIRPTAT